MTVATRALAIIGVIAVIGLGLWGVVAVAQRVPAVFGSLASAIVSLTSVFVPAASEEAIVLTAPSTVESGKTINLSWDHEGKSGEGSYTLRYSCVDDVTVTSPTPSGSSVSVFCNTPFNFLNASNAVTITPTLAKDGSAIVVVYVDYTKTGASAPSVTGSATFTLEGKEDTAPTTPTPTTPRPTNPTPGTPTSGLYPISGGGSGVSNPNGFVDLTVRVLEVGVVDKTTGAFTASSTPKRTLTTHRVAVRFAIENVGSKTSDQWSFNAVLPTYPSHIFSSPTQQALGPGDRIEFTIGFDSLADANEGILIINVDPSSRINEPNKVNNILRYTIYTVK